VRVHAGIGGAAAEAGGRVGAGGERGALAVLVRARQPKVDEHPLAGRKRPCGGRVCVGGCVWVCGCGCGWVWVGVGVRERECVCV